MSLHPRLQQTQRYVIRLWREFSRDQCAVRASGLAFASLLALVPVSALLFSLFSSLGTFADLVESIQSFLVRVLVPTKHEEILSYVNQFVANTRRLGVFGLLVFLAISILLLAAIQRTFDSVWGTSSKKNTVRKFATYMSFVIVGSFLLSLGLNISGLLGTFFQGVLPLHAGKFLEAVLRIFPIVFLFAAQFLLIRFVPAGPVRSKSALVGAVVGAVLWEVARFLFLFWANYVIRLSVIYGSLAVIPIFLIWLYVAWMIVLLSLEVAFVHQHKKHVGEGRAVWELDPADFLHSGLELYLKIARDFAAGRTPPTTSALAMALHLTQGDVTYLIKKFTAGSLVITTGDRMKGFVPSRALDTISAEEVARCVFGTRPEAEPLYRTLIENAIDSIRGTTIKDYALDETSVEEEAPIRPDNKNGRFMTALKRLLTKIRPEA